MIDSHCHLDFPELQKDISGLLNRAGDCDIIALQTICTNISKFEKIYEITKIKHDKVKIFCSVGNHPCNLDKEPIAYKEEILQIARLDGVIGIGETGLDYYHSCEFVERQKESFIEHIKAAQESGLPIIIHTREAEEDTVAILQKCMAQQKFTGLIHCMTGSDWLAEKCLELGLYISASGIVTFKNAQKIRDTFASVPINRILIETDAPYLAPVPYRSKVNEPSYVRYVAKEIAKIKGVSEEEIMRITTANFAALFNKSGLDKINL